jgi:hypothetical protein
MMSVETKVQIRKRAAYEVEADHNVSEEGSGKFVNEKMFDFGRYTIEDRAVPDFRDGHKPVHRRLIYALYNMQGSPNGTFMKCTRPVAECFVAGTLINMKHGVKCIEDIKTGDYVQTSNGFKKVTETFIMPSRETVNVRLSDKSENVCTPNQEFKVLNEHTFELVWKRADKLKSGEYVASIEIKRASLQFGIADLLRRFSSDLPKQIEDDFVHRGITFKRVISVTTAKTQDTFDIQVNEDHEFIANGVLVHNCMGKYHPHGSSYMSLVEMTWERYPLINGQGNFGSLLGDPPAADRYVECRVSKLVKHHFSCIDVAEMSPTYSGEFNEPVVINTRLPFLLMNGASGIATGVTTKIPSHNVGELCQAFEYVARNWKTASVEGMLEFVKGPDFLYGGVVTSSKADLIELYRTGIGKLTFSCDYKIEPSEKNSSITNIVVTGFPDAFNTATFLSSTVPELTANHVIVDFDERYNKKTRELHFTLSVDNASALKKVVAALQSTTTYRFNVTKRKSGDDDGASTEFESTNLLKLSKDWLLWRMGEETKMLKLELKKLNASKFLEDCKIIALSHARIIFEATQQPNVTEERMTAYLVAKLKISNEQAETVLKFPIKDLSRFNERTIREKIKNLEAEIARVLNDLKRPMAIVVKYLREVVKDTDERRTRIGSRLQDERKMVQQGDARMFGVTTDGKLLGAIDEKGSNSGDLFVVPSYEGIAIFGRHGTVGFFGPSATGKAGVGFDSIVGAAGREAQFLIALGANGHVLKVEQNRDSNKGIPVFLKDTETNIGLGANDQDILVAWGENGETKSVKIASLGMSRKNVRGTKVFGFSPIRAVAIHRGQKLITSDGNSLSVKSADGLGDATPFVLGPSRNLCILPGGRRKFIDGHAVLQAMRKGDVKSVFDASLSTGEPDAGK